VGRAERLLVAERAGEGERDRDELLVPERDDLGDLDELLVTRAVLFGVDAAVRVDV